MKNGILVHGRHVKANGWDRLVWGDPTEQKLGSLPMMVLTALNLGLNNIVVVFGTGASVREEDGVLEADCMKNLLIDRQAKLGEFNIISDHPKYDSAKLSALIEGVITETKSQNTNQEIENTALIFDRHEVGMVYHVSSASHLPRCAKTVSELREKGLLPIEQMWCGVADHMAFGDLGAGATAILETPHRGDDPMGQVDPSLWPSSVVPMLFKLPLDRRITVLASMKQMIEGELAAQVA